MPIICQIWSIITAPQTTYVEIVFHSFEIFTLQTFLVVVIRMYTCMTVPLELAAQLEYLNKIV